MIYKCQNCGGNVIYDPQRRKMYCPHCDGIDSEAPVSSRGITQCANCGAPIQIGPYTSAGRCAHCGSYIIFEERVEGQFTPHLILPFKVSRKDAEDMLKKEFGKRIFAPSAFLSRASLEKMEGVYVPFFMYDYHADYDWAGRATKVRKWTSGDTEYTETKIFHVERDMDIDFSRIPVDASLAMEDRIMDLMEPYDYQALEQFQMKYMSGFYGEMYNMGSAELEPRARRKAENDSEDLMRQSLTGYTSLTPERRNLQIQNKATDYALLPVWVYTYEYGGEYYRFHVNGQTGKIIGKAPVSKAKIVGYSASVFGFVLAGCQLLNMILGVL